MNDHVLSPNVCSHNVSGEHQIQKSETLSEHQQAYRMSERRCGCCYVKFAAISKTGGCNGC